MSTNNEQNGCQPPLPNRLRLSSDSRAGNVSPRPLCRKYVWGTCTKGLNCKFRHDLDIEEMKKILKFCHDFQNKQGVCGREECTYLHASKEEENLFRNNNKIPRILLERYAALADPNSMQNFEGVPQVMMFLTAPPPPPPPPTQMTPVVALPPPPPPPAPVFPVIHQPPPPPPPPTVSTTPVAQTPAVFTSTALQGTSMTFPMSQPPPPQLLLPPLFDASRPPPPIPVQTKSATKRRLECEAGPSKVRKAEGSKPEACENCVQREIRMTVYKQEIEKISCELKYQKLVYKKKINEFENGREILRSLVSTEMFRILEEHIEGGPPQVQDILAQISTNPFMSILEYLINGARNVNTAPSLRLEDTLELTTLPRISNSLSHPSPELLQRLIEVFRKTNSERESRTEPEVRTSTPTSSNVNGLNRFANGQLTDVSAPTASTSSRYAQFGSSPRSYPSQSTAGPSSAPPPAPPGPSPAPAAAPPPPAPAYPPFHPAVPPPTNRPYFQPYSGSATNMQYQSPRAGSAQMLPRLAAPPPPAPAPGMPPNYAHYNMMGRYPQPHPPQYYPPYQ